MEITWEQRDKTIRLLPRQRGNVNMSEPIQNPVGANLWFDGTGRGKKLFQKLKFWNSRYYESIRHNTA
ncbi:MAG: hypothetical protein LBD65_02905, partial [Spirochaetaceae bacterium]|nr:hypothetical protein [Spirochaetaceae bacterium]